MKTAIFCIIIFLLLMMFACNPCRYVAHHPECFPPDSVQITSTQVIKDSFGYVLPDSGSLIALFYCDSANHVIMQELQELKGKGVQTVTIFKDNKLTFRWATDSIKVLNRIISNIKSEKITVMNPVNAELQRQNTKMEKQLHNKTRMNRILWIVVIILILIDAVYVWFKLK